MHVAKVGGGRGWVGFNQEASVLGEALGQPGDVTIDLSGISFLTPSISCLLAATALTLSQQGRALQTVPPSGGKDVAAFAKSIGLGRFPGMECFGHRDGESPGGDRYLGPTVFEDEAVAGELADQVEFILSRQADLPSHGLQRIADYVDELADNVLIHSRCPWGGLVAAQTWETWGWMEISVVDTGVGIPERLRLGGLAAGLSDQAALDKAIEAGVSTRVGHGAGIHGGMGLPLVLDAVENARGKLEIRTLGARFPSTGRSPTALWPGTAVSIFLGMPEG